MTSKNAQQRKSKSKSIFAGLLIALAALFGWCGRGFFPGDGKPGDESKEEESTKREIVESATPTNDASPARCALRVDAEGIKVGDQLTELKAAVESCSATGEAELIVTGDANFGTADALRTALDEAGVRVFESKRGAQRPDELPASKTAE